jgi:hypothetical protein
MNQYLERAKTAMEEVTRDMTLDDLRRHAPKKWCTAEILDHLAQTFSSSAKLLQRHLSKGEPCTRRQTLKERLAVLLVVKAGYLPKGRKAPDFAVPQGIEAGRALPYFEETLSQMDDAIARCEQKFGASVTIAAHPILGPLTAEEWRKFHWVHTRHHVRQVAHLRENLKE